MMNNFLLPGLQDLCVSRTSFSWGIPVTFDEGHVTYVWLDALSNYITGLGYECYKESADSFKKYWPEDLHLIGKDIVRFHTIYWPIFLMALGVELPKQVFGHPWLLLGEGKMSKSKGNVLYADTLVKLFGVDAVRYFVLHEMPYDRDGVISVDLIVERYNSDLANVLGNLVSRTISMSNKYFEGVVSKGQESADSEEDKALDKDLKDLVSSTAAKVSEKMERFRVADAISEIWNIFKRSNKYIDETYPWVLAKDEDKKERLKTVLYNLTESILIGASLLESFMPETSQAILAQLNASRREYEDLDKFGLTDSIKVVEKPSILFARLELDKVMEEYEALSGIDNAAASVEEESDDGMDIEAKPEVEYEDFDKLQIQIGKIIHCEEVKKSKKLLCSQIKIGSSTRQILSGIKAWYKPEDLIGKKVLVLVNLKPRQIAGLTSEGMVLCAEDNEGNLSIISPEKNMRSGAYVC
jgi:methionine--tRNA ligase, beta subunit